MLYFLQLGCMARYGGNRTNHIFRDNMAAGFLFENPSKRKVQEEILNR